MKHFVGEIFGLVLGGLFLVMLAAILYGEPEGATRRLRVLKGVGSIVGFVGFLAAVGLVVWLFTR